MGIDHGETGDKSPEFGVGDGNANCPLRFCHIGKKERSVAFKIRQNPFSAVALPRTPLGALTTLPRPLVGWRRDTPHHTPPHSAATHLRRSPCVPLRISARSTPMAAVRVETTCRNWTFTDINSRRIS